MNESQRKVLEFHKKFGISIEDKPTIVSQDTKHLRIVLMEEELKELKHAMEDENIVMIADGIADLLYVIYGLAISYGLDVEPIFEEVHRSNMSKGDPEIIRRNDGKVIKGKSWSPPELEDIIHKMEQCYY